MATTVVTVRQTLESDSALTTLMPGGVFDYQELGREGLTLENAPKLPDGIRIQPVIVLRWRNSIKYGPTALPAESRALEVWLYTDNDYAAIESAKNRIKALLHHQLFVVDDFALCYLVWASDLGEFRADELGGAAADRSRFQVILLRE